MVQSLNSPHHVHIQALEVQSLMGRREKSTVTGIVLEKTTLCTD